MKIDTSRRTTQAEIMDDFQLEGEELRDALDKIASINRLLGGNKLTLQGVKQLLRRSDGSRPVHIVDIGCGNGDMLRMLADYGKKHGVAMQLTGIDANAFTIAYARNCSKDYPDITFECLDIFEERFAKKQYDIALCTLTLHHFKDAEIVKLMRTFLHSATVGVVVNDLQRSRWAYRLFQVVCTLFGLNRMSREDGLVSILRGFRKHELKAYSREAGFSRYTINWRWAYRYEWIIYKQ